MKAILLNTSELDNQDLYYIFQSYKILTEHLLKLEQKYKENNNKLYNGMISNIRDVINYYITKYPFIDMLSSDNKHEDIWKFKDTNDDINTDKNDNNNNNNDDDDNDDEFSDWDADSNDDESENEKNISISKDISSRTLKEIQHIKSLLDK
jgi:hypothetical protein